MTTIADGLPPGVPATAARRSALPPLVLALGRGFTLVGWAAVVFVNGIYGATAKLGLGPVGDVAVMALAGFLFVALFDGVATLIWKILNGVLPRVRLGRVNEMIQAVPGAMIGRLIGILLMVFGNVLWPELIFQYATLLLPGKLLVMAAAVGGALLFGARAVQRPPVRTALIVLGLLPLIILPLCIFLPGTDDYLAAAQPVDPAIKTLPAANPGLPGDYMVATLSYGRGDNRRRPEFADEATLTTPAVDGSTIFQGYSGLSDSYYRWYNGFSMDNLPLNGLVWYPEGEGPFPLVLIVHGNHAMAEPSDPGYAYLGEHLAGRGMIAVSVDENFLNGFALDDPDMEEMPLRAWLLLKHLEQWREWNGTPGNPFYGRVDLARVALIGHSRGGEAVAHAAEMNVRPIGRIGTVSKAADFGFGIRSVIALAPCDNRYKPAGRPLRLRNVDYLLLASAHDGDMNYLDGLGQYHRTTFADNPDGFKALAYLYRGNHGNFNTVWGDADQGQFESLVLNRQPLLSAAEQEQAAKVFISGFLEASLNERAEYRALFYNPAAARAWLPNDIVVTQYADDSFIPLDTNERGSLSETDVPGGATVAQGMSTWQAVGRTLRDGETTVPNRGLLLEWAAGAEPSYALELPAGAAAEWGLTPDDALSFTLASMMPEGAPGAVAVELETTGGTVVRLPLTQFGPLQPALPVRLTKAEWLANAPGIELALASPIERVDQTFDLPLSAFVVADPAFRAEELSAIRFIFDGQVDGRLLLDEIGLRRP